MVLSSVDFIIPRTPGHRSSLAVLNEYLQAAKPRSLCMQNNTNDNCDKKFRGKREVSLKCVIPFMYARVTSVTAGQPVAYVCDKKLEKFSHLDYNLDGQCFVVNKLYYNSEIAEVLILCCPCLGQRKQDRPKSYSIVNIFTETEHPPRNREKKEQVYTQH